MTAQQFIENLPQDWESASRALCFQNAVDEAETHPEAMDLVTDVYKLAGSSLWASIPLYDLNMLVYSLRGHSRVIEKVGPEVERLLNPFKQQRAPFLDTWSFIKRLG